MVRRLIFSSKPNIFVSAVRGGVFQPVLHNYRDVGVILYKLCQKCQGHKSQYLVLKEAALSQKPGQSLAESNGKQLQELDSTVVDKGEVAGPNELSIRQGDERCRASRGCRRVDESQLGKHLISRKANKTSPLHNCELSSASMKSRSSNVFRRLVDPLHNRWHF